MCSQIYIYVNKLLGNNKGSERYKRRIKEGRIKTVEALSNQGLIEKIEDYEHSIGHCQRCGSIIESLISKQWFVKTKPLAEKAIKAVKSGEIKIVPKRFEKVTKRLEQ